MKKNNVAILQSNYIPWKGYFDIISNVDLFVFHDDIQYTKNDWRNRNKIYSNNGLIWLTIPCGVNTKRLICEVYIEDNNWQKKHWNLIQKYYKNAPYFDYYKDYFSWFYLDNIWKNLSELNQVLIKKISLDFLDLNIKFRDTREFNLEKKKGDRVLEILNIVKATDYFSGPSAKSYINCEKFEDNNIKLHWMNYSYHPEYTQLHNPFEHNISILDLLFNIGKDSKYFIRSNFNEE